MECSIKNKQYNLHLTEIYNTVIQTLKYAYKKVPKSIGAFYYFLFDAAIKALNIGCPENGLL